MESFSITMRSTTCIDKYPAKAHARRVAEEAGLTAGIIGLLGTETAFYHNSDQPQPFRQDRYFYYLSGCDEPNCFLVYDIAKDLLTLYLPPVDYTRFYFDGRGSTIEEALEKYDIDAASYHLSGKACSWRELSARLMQAGFVVHKLEGSNANSQGNVLRRALDACRSIKDAHEIALIRQANDISSAAHKEVLLHLHDCNSEAEAEAIYMRTCIAKRAKEQAYGPIFGAGANASQLHYIDNDDDFADSQLLLVDAGCEWQRYASDVTRTVPLNRKSPGEWPSQQAKLVYEAVEKIQEKCIQLMRPGTKFSFVANTAQHLAIDALLELGILKGDHDDIWNAGTSRAFFPHGLGHHLGLEVHDVSPPLTIISQGTVLPDDGVPNFHWGHHGSMTAHQRTGRLGKANWPSPLSHSATPGEPAMEPGNVITIEPGLYFNDVILDRFFLHNDQHKSYINVDVLKSFMPVGGVRIEDDILISKNGPTNLTTAPKGVEMLEILRRSSTKE